MRGGTQVKFCSQDIALETAYLKGLVWQPHHCHQQQSYLELYLLGSFEQLKKGHINTTIWHRGRTATSQSFNLRISPLPVPPATPPHQPISIFDKLRLLMVTLSIATSNAAGPQEKQPSQNPVVDAARGGYDATSVSKEDDDDSDDGTSTVTG